MFDSRELLGNCSEGAQASQRYLVEVPFTLLLTPTGAAELPRLLRGVIDLVFREPKGWVIVDYKTDSCAESEVQGLVAHYRGQLFTYADAWQQMVGYPVQKKGLFFGEIRSLLDHLNDFGLSGRGTSSLLQG